jgi:signal transduction histidine kinase
MNPFALSGLLTGITSLVFGYFVYQQGKDKKLNVLWFIFAISVAAWGLGGLWIALAPTETEALWAWRLSFAIGVVWIAPLFYHFVHIFCGLTGKRPLQLAYASAVLFCPLIFTDLFFSGVRYTFSSFYYSVPGHIFPFFFIWWSGLIVYSHYELVKAHRHSSGQKKNQIGYFFLATAVGYSGGSLDYLPIFGVDLYPYGNFAIALYPPIMTYAIVRYRLMDITIVVHKGLAYGLLLAAVLIPISLTIVISERVTPHSVPPLLAGAFILGCGFWVFLKQTQAVTNAMFSLACLAASVWLFGFFMAYSSDSRAEAAFWGKFVYVGVVYIPALFYHFSVSLLGNRVGTRLVASNYFISTVFLLLIPTPYLLNGVHSYFWGYYPKAGLLHPLFLVYFGSICGLGLFQIFRGYEAAMGTNAPDAKRLKTVFWAFVVGYAASLDFAQVYGHEWYPFGGLLASACVALTSYALTRYEASENALLPAQPQLVSYLKALGFVPIYLAVLLLIKLFTGTAHYLLAGVLLATFMAFAGMMAGIQRRVEKAIERMLFKQRHDAYETLIEFSKAMVTILDLSALNSTIMDTLARVLGIEKISVFLLDKEKGQYYLAAAHGLDFDEMKTVTFSSSARLPQHLARTRSIAVLEELRQDQDNPAEQAVLDSLQLLHAELCIPLINKDRLIGFFNFGKRASRSMYSEADLALLTTLAQNAAVALDNAMLYEDLRRSRLLMRRTDRLRSLETIAGGFAHEIRNPLTSIKTFVQLAPERKHDDEFIGHFSQIVHEDVLRIERLIQEILDYARYMEPKFSVENLNDIVSSCLYFVEVKAESKGIMVEKDFARALPAVMLDRQQIKQVLLNLLINAMEAMGDRGGRLTVRTRPLHKSGGDMWAQVEVCDTGPGIAPADLDHIFDPFYTTKHHSEEREGTGLGLTIVHQIVQEHHGYIEVESQLGRGTTFFVNVPIRQPEDLFSRERVEHEKTDSVGR